LFRELAATTSKDKTAAGIQYGRLEFARVKPLRVRERLKLAARWRRGGFGGGV